MTIHTEIFNFIWKKVATHSNKQSNPQSKDSFYTFEGITCYTEDNDRYLVTDTLEVSAIWQGKTILHFTKGSTSELSDLFNVLCP